MFSWEIANYCVQTICIKGAHTMCNHTFFFIQTKFVHGMSGSPKKFVSPPLSATQLHKLREYCLVKSSKRTSPAADAAVHKPSPQKEDMIIYIYIIYTCMHIHMHIVISYYCLDRSAFRNKLDLNARTVYFWQKHRIARPELTIYSNSENCRSKSTSNISKIILWYIFLVGSLGHSATYTAFWRLHRAI